MGSKYNKVGVKQGWVHVKSQDLKNGYNIDKNHYYSKPNNFDYYKPEPEEKPSRELGCCTKVLLYTCLIFLPIAFAMSVIGFGTPYWIYNENSNTSLGLFQACAGSPVSCTSAFSVLSSNALNGTWVFVIGFQSAGLLLLLLSVIFLMCIYIHCSIKTKGSVAFGIVTAIMVLFGSACVLTGMFFMLYFTIYNAGYILSFSFYFAAIGGGLGCLVFLFLLAHICLVGCQCDLD